MRFLHLIRYMLTLAVACFLTACDVHEFPRVPERVPFTLHLDCNAEIPIYREIDYHTRSRHATKEHDVRYILNIYRSEEGRAFSRSADSTIVFTKSYADDRSHSIPLHLPDGLYQFMVWSDHVDAGTDCDKYYDTSDFSEIIYAHPQAHRGCNDYKDAFRGHLQVDIHADTGSDGGVVHQEATVSLERPFGKFKFIATDLTDFVSRVVEQQRLKGKEPSRTLNPDDFRIVFRYTGFMPCAFNMFTNKPSDAWTGMSFDGKLVPVDEQEAELGFDYVFVNGTESTVNVAVEVYDKYGELIGGSDVVDVPVVRSKLTVVRGKFLTAKATGSIGISPGFAGDYTIYVK